MEKSSSKEAALWGERQKEILGKLDAKLSLIEEKLGFKVDGTVTYEQNYANIGIARKEGQLESPEYEQGEEKVDKLEKFLIDVANKAGLSSSDYESHPGVFQVKVEHLDKFLEAI